MWGEHPSGGEGSAVDSSAKLKGGTVREIEVSAGGHLFQPRPCSTAKDFFSPGLKENGKDEVRGKIPQL